MGSIYTDYCFCLSADLDLCFKVFVSHAACSLPDALGIRAEDVFVSARLVDGGAALHACTRATRSPVRSGGHAYWNEWLTFPVKIRDLPRTAQLVVTLVGPEFRVLGGSTVRCFDERSALKRGLQHVTIWPSTELAEAAAAAADPGAPPLPLVVSDGALEHLKRLEAFQLGELQTSPWTDRLAFAQLRRELRELGAEGSGGGGSSGGATAPSRLVLQFPAFDFPVVYEDLSYHDAVAAATGGGAVAPMIPPPPGPPASFAAPAGAAAAGALSAAAGGYTPTWYENSTLGVIADPEADVDNPCESMAQWLSRGLLRTAVNPDLKPNVLESAAIQAAIAAPIRVAPDLPTKNLLWQFRYSLTGNKKALVKFVMSVMWQVEDDAREAAGLLGRWKHIDPEDALLLLLPEFTADVVREHAVEALRRASDGELLLYLLQLVQALRYEPALIARAGAPVGSSTDAGSLPAAHSRSGASVAPDAAAASAAPVSSAAASSASGSSSSSSGGKRAVRLSPLADFLIERACCSLELANFLHWYLTVELEDAYFGVVYAQIHQALIDSLATTALGSEISSKIAAQAAFLQQLIAALHSVTSSKRDNVQTKIDKLNALFVPGGGEAGLVHLGSPVCAPVNPLVLLSGVHPRGCNIFKSKVYPTVVTFAVHPASSLDWAAQGPVTAGLQLSEAAAREAARARQQWSSQHAANPPPLARPARQSAVLQGRRSILQGPSSAALNALLLDGGGSGGEASDGDTSPSPLPSATPEVSAADAAAMQQVVTRAVASVCTAASPPATYKLLFKNGDDLRQDQLIIQLIHLMDSQLKRVGLDLCLMPYRVLATSTTTGIMELVLDSRPVSAVFSKYKNDIAAFFREKHPDPGAEFGFSAEVMDTYIKSLAGYSVITYLLGIGDRHLDNIMLQSDGHLFHLDFGYIFGRDPKPFPAAVRLTKEMIDAMGGPAHLNYQRFVKYCCQAYNVLRRSTNVVLSLIMLMRDAGVEALRGSREQTDTTIAKIQEKFRVDLDDEAAEAYFLKLVDDSVAAFFPAFFEVIHKWRVAMR